MEYIATKVLDYLKGFLLNRISDMIDERLAYMETMVTILCCLFTASVLVLIHLSVQSSKRQRKESQERGKIYKSLNQIELNVRELTVTVDHLKEDVESITKGK